MRKANPKTSRSTKLYTVRDKATGQFVEVAIVSPKKGPTSVGLTAIRRAVRDIHAARKAK